MSNKELENVQQAGELAQGEVESKAPRRLLRSRQERVLFGLCGGIGRYFHIDPVLVRALWVLFSLATGVVPGVLLYIMATVVVPEAPRELEEPAPRWRLPVENHVLWGGLLVLAGIYFLFKTFGRYAHTWAPDLARYWDLLWASIRGLALPAVLIGIGLLLVFGVARRGEHKPTRRLTRSGDDRIIAGVCGGLGRFLKIDSTWIRLGFVGLTLTGGVGLLLYLVAVLAMPEEISRELTVPQEPELD